MTFFKKLLLVIVVISTFCNVAFANSHTIQELENLAAEGNIDSMRRLGARYLDGDGVKKDIGKGMNLVTKAANNGDEIAMVGIGNFYEFGKYGVPIKLDKAFEWYLKGAEAGQPVGQYNVSRFYYEGLGGLDINLDKAQEWAQKALESEHPNAQEMLDNIVSAKTIYDGKNLMLDMRANQLRFDKQFNGKTINVRGYVGDLKEVDSGYMLSLYGEKTLPNPFEFVECFFGSNAEDQLLDLNRGDTVLIRGTYRGKRDFQVGSFAMYDCEVIR